MYKHLRKYYIERKHYINKSSFLGVYTLKENMI